MFIESMNASAALRLKLQENLDAAVSSPSAFKTAKQLTTIMTESDDEQPTHRSISPTLKDDDKSADFEDASRSTYRDFSHVLPEKALDPGVSGVVGQPTTAKEPTFPVKLHMILSNPEFQDIISWLPHGRSWRILQQNAFEERVIPLYFRHGRYSSFARQVNGWGFRRVTHGSDYNSYYHEMFLRGMPHLCAKMRRLTKADNAARKKHDDEPTPDFYALSRANPLPESNPTSSLSNSRAPASLAASMAATNPLAGLPSVGGIGAGLDASLPLLADRRRNELLDRMNANQLLAGGLPSMAGALNSGLPSVSAAAGLQPSDLLKNSMNMGGAFGMMDPLGAAPTSNASSLQQLLGVGNPNVSISQLLALNGGMNGAGLGAGGLGSAGLGSSGLGSGGLGDLGSNLGGFNL